MKQLKSTVSAVIILVFLIFVNSCNKEEENNSNESTNTIPTCEITSPQNGEEIEQGTIATIIVNAEDVNGNINEVSYYIDDIEVGSSDSYPYYYTWNTSNQSIGNHSIKAIAEDNESGTKSDEVSISIVENTAHGVPCPGIPTITYEGQVYNTVQIGDQCWLKENLNIGTMINVNEDMTNNGTIEKYCYFNDAENCAIYGGLYQWEEIMQYISTEGVQGICPPDWHIPTDEEWKILEGRVDSQFGYPDAEWDQVETWRGFDAGTHLKSTSGWSENGNGDDLFGFRALPGGWRNGYGVFEWRTSYGFFWSSTKTEYNKRRYRNLWKFENKIKMNELTTYQHFGSSVRCLKD